MQAGRGEEEGERWESREARRVLRRGGRYGEIRRRRTVRDEGGTEEGDEDGESFDGESFDEESKDDIGMSLCPYLFLIFFGVSVFCIVYLHLL